MRRVILYIAISLDGYIADCKGSVDWIKGQEENDELEDTFTPFFNSVDAVVMGRKTYEQIVTELSPTEWPYAGATTYVLTHRKTDDMPHIRFIDRDVCQLVEDLKLESRGKNIWICGGAEIAQQLLADNLIDIYHLAIIPVVLGNGTRLFGNMAQQIGLKLIRAKKYNGIIEVMYQRRKEDTPL